MLSTLRFLCILKCAIQIKSIIIIIIIIIMMMQSASYFHNWKIHA